MEQAAGLVGPGGKPLHASAKGGVGTVEVGQQSNNLATECAWRVFVSSVWMAKVAPKEPVLRRVLLVKGSERPFKMGTMSTGTKPRDLSSFATCIFRAC